MDIVKLVADAWGWKGLRPKTVIDHNAFGNLIICDDDGVYWRICPEELSCSVVARTDAEYRDLRRSEDFRRDWEMPALVKAASDIFGPLPEGRCYCLKIPAVLEGAYEPANFGTISISELTSFAGDMARQINDAPNGTKVRLKFID